MSYSKKQLKTWINIRRRALELYKSISEKELEPYYKGCLDELRYLENELDGLNG